MTDIHNGSKLVVIGLDGATWQVLTPLIQAGKMPVLQQLVDKGVTGPLESTLPDLTPPAWTSFATGKHPDNHGVFGFEQPGPQNQIFTPITSHSIRAEVLWQILSRYGVKVGVVNVPVTFPPKPLNGFMVAGMFTPSSQHQFTYPSDLQAEVIELVGKYQVDIPWRTYLDRDPMAFLTDLESMTQQRAKIVRYLQDRHPVDVLVAVFVGPDRIHHALWGYTAADTGSGDLPNFVPIHERIVAFYTALDKIIGEITTAAGPQANCILMSDHGFGPYRRTVYLNKWLSQIGLLTPRGSPLWQSLYGELRKIRKKLNLSRQRLDDVLGLESVRKLKQISSRIDWKRTKAYTTCLGIRINLAGREREGLVQPGTMYESLQTEIIRQLSCLVDPETGEQAFTGFRKEDIYQGKYAREAPVDIVLVPNGTSYVSPSQAINVPDIFAKPAGWSPGYHRPDGIFLASGPVFREHATIADAHIVDITPTILYTLGLPIPDDLDGRLLESAFAPDFRRMHQTRRETSPDTGCTSRYSDQDTLSEQDRAIVEDRLRSLGYL